MTYDGINILAAISGGRSSAMMAYQLKNDPKYQGANIAYVFSNTGMENPKTINFLKDIEKYWEIPLVKVEGTYSMNIGEGVGYNIRDWDELDMGGNVFSAMIAQYNKYKIRGLPHSLMPYCSDRLKERPMDRFAKDFFSGKKYIKAIGFRAEDMPKRISWPEIREEKKKIFPLITDFPSPITQGDLTLFFQKQQFKLEIHSKLGNCELCWKKSDRNLIMGIQAGSRFVQWWKDHEAKYGNTSFRGNKSISDYEAMANSGKQTEIDFGPDDDLACMC
jgi:3'-phosphoadenosine 5'-phosphosulfate sulfotransferase (PAPS reductase)/FAD synthetase